MHYYKRNLGDYAKKAGRLTMLQHGAYTLLTDACYDREKFPTLEQAIDWTWASTEAEIEAVKFVLTRFFELDKDGQYVQNRILEELLHYHKNADTNKRIADEREAKRKEQRTKREQSVNEAPPNQEPLTNNQEPLLEVAKATRPRQAGTPPAPIQEIVDMYNSQLPMLSAVTVINDSRRRAISARWREVVTADKLDREKGIEFFQWFFDMVSKSKFLTGRVKDWKADIDFLFNASKFPRIVEGAYHKE
jgi:uncharacterized protein YdaU (DUF1376 family)